MGDVPGPAAEPMPAVDPDARVEVIDVMLGLLGAFISMWHADPTNALRQIPDGTEPLQADHAALWGELLASRLGTTEAQDFAEACASDDPDVRRLATLLATTAADYIDKIVEHMDEFLAEGEYWRVERNGTFVADLLVVLGREPESVVPLWTAARAAHRQQRGAATVALLRRAVAAPTTGEHRAVLCACEDLLGLRLAAEGQVPEGLAHHQKALELVGNEGARAYVLINLAATLAAAGRYEAAEQRAQDAYDAGVRAGLSRTQLGIFLDTVADIAQSNGDLDRSASLRSEAETLLAAAPWRDRAVNLLAQADVAGERGDAAGRAEAFERMHGLVESSCTTFDLTHYRQGLLSWGSRQLPEGHEAYQWFGMGMQQAFQGSYQGARQAFGATADRAARERDMILHLRSLANLASSAFQAGDWDSLLHLAELVRDRSHKQGIALTEAMASGILASAYAEAGVGSVVDRVALNLQARRLYEIHREVMESRPDIVLRVPDFSDPSTPWNGLGLLARDYDALALASSYLRKAYAAAEEMAVAEPQLTRGGNLLLLWSRDPALTTPDEVQQVLARIAELLEPRPDVPVPTRLRIALTLHGRRDEGEQLLKEISLPPLEELETVVEQIRDGAPVGSERAQVDIVFPAHRLRARRAHRAGRDEEGWSALQQLRARDLLEVLSAQDGEPHFRPPDLAEARALLSRLPRPAAFVDIEGYDGGLHASVVTPDGFERVHAIGDLTPVRRLRWGDPLRRAADTVKLVRTDPVLRRLSEEIRAVCGEKDLLLTTDDEYSNVPWHMIPVEGDQTWGRRQLLSRLPAVAVLRRDLGAPRSGRSLVAGDSRGDLPGAASECGHVAALLGSDPLVGRRCSVDALAAAGPGLDFLHLAVHGYADPRAGGSSSLLFAHHLGDARDGDGTRWISWAELVGLPWRARVATFSGCSTAVGGPRHGRGLYGITQSAMNNGAGSVLASLWPVDDLQTAAFMTAVYDDVLAQWEERRDADLRLALRAGAERLEPRSSPAGARRPVTRDAREFDLPAASSASPLDEAHAWSVAEAFTLVGDPILAHGG